MSYIFRWTMLEPDVLQLLVLFIISLNQLFPMTIIHEITLCFIFYNHILIYAEELTSHEALNSVYYVRLISYMFVLVGHLWSHDHLHIIRFGIIQGKMPFKFYYYEQWQRSYGSGLQPKRLNKVSFVSSSIPADNCIYPSCLAMWLNLMVSK